MITIRPNVSSFVFFLILVGFGAPWAWLLYRRSSERTLEALLDRISLGYAISFAALFVSAQLRLWLFLPIWLAGVVACAVDGFVAKGPRPLRVELGREGQVVLGSSLLYLVLRCLPFQVRRLPLGWDAYFHMTISESIVERGRAVHDWLPFENIPLNYPIGAHLLLAFSQWLTAVRPHQFFEMFTVVFTLLSGLQLYSLATRATQDRNIGCYAALSYLFLASYGSLHYTIWSGLPNLIGMYLFLGLLSTLTAEQGSLVRSTATFVTYLLAACFVHHHVMVTSGLCLAWTAAFLFVRRERAAAKQVSIGLIASGLIGSPYFLMYLLRTVGLGDTGIQDYLEDTDDAWAIAQELGLGFTLFAVAGVCLYLREGPRVSPFVTQPLTAMLVLYVAIEFVFRTLSQTLLRHEMAPFTPSRFITDAVTLLSVFAGIFFRWVQGSRESNRLPIVAMILAGFFIFNRGVYRQTFDHEIARDRRATYEWIRRNASADAVLLDSDLHATYMTRRMSSSFPLPTSEYSSLAENRKLLEAIAAGHKPPEAAGRPVLQVTPPGERAPDGKLLWAHPRGFRVYERFAPQR